MQVFRGINFSFKNVTLVMNLQRYVPAFTQLGWLILVSGFSAVLTLHILFSVAGLPPGSPTERWFIMFILLNLLSVTTSRRFNTTVVRTIETFIATVRVTLLNRVRTIGLAAFEQVGVERIYTALTAGLKGLANVSFVMAITLNLLINIVFMVGYLAWLAWPIFLLEMGVIGGVGLFYLYNQLRIKQTTDSLRHGETLFFGAITHLLEGFKELRLNNRKNDAFFQTRFKRLVTRLTALRLAANRSMLMNKTLVYGVWTGLIGLLPLILPLVAIATGSGKSTLVRLMLGLYTPAAGHTLLNGQEIDIRRHRYLFATIFSDFHLFDRFYGLSGVDEKRVNNLLTVMQLENKVQFTDGTFSTLYLSIGQKKRLALLMAIMEDRPIYVFDEWAAKQDPHFRHYFYETLLPTFKAQGKTVIAVTHDDHGSHIADRVINMEYGQIL